MTTPAATANTPLADLRTLGQSWNRFWFDPADPTPLGLIRILAGLVVLYVHLAYSLDLDAFFGRNALVDLDTANAFRRESPWVAPPLSWDAPAPRAAFPDSPPERERLAQYVQRWGIDPRLTSAQGNYYWGIWYHLTDPFWMRVVHGGALAVMALFTVGLWTRVTSVLTWLTALSYIQRTPTSLFGMDAVIALTLLYLMIGPSGAALSVDRLLARRRAARAGQPPADRPEPSASANLALRLMQVHFSIIYLAAGLSKLLGASWWGGTAVWWTLANFEFTPLRHSFYVAALRWLSNHRWLVECLTSAGVIFTLALEISFPFLAWRRHGRWLMICGAVLLHTSISLTMGLIGFGLIMLALVLSFVPAEAIHELLGKGARRAAYV